MNEPTTPSDAPPSDAHKCGYICNHCKQHFPGYAQYWEHKCKTATLPESSDAPTPETEANEFAIYRAHGPTEASAVDSNFARRLERERNQWKESCFKADEICLEVMRERDEARAEIKERNKPDWCCKECGSFGPFEDIVYPDTPNGPAEYDMKCEECGSLDICENAREVVRHWMEAAGDLKGELDEARAELAKLKTSTPPTEGSAVEWYRTELNKAKCGPAEALVDWLVSLGWTLARRCDEAEKPGWYQACMKIGVLLAPITQATGVVEAVEELYIQRADLLHQVGDLRAQLAAAQDEAAEMREACEPLIEAIIEMQHDSNTDYKLGSLAQLDFNAVFNRAVKLGAALDKKERER